MTDHRIRSGSLQFYPRKRARKVLPSVNWKAVPKDKKGLLGFIGYKVGMISVYAKDNTEHSMTKNKKIIIPSTILECPEMKILSVRFYKDNNIVNESIVGFNDELKKKIKKPKEIKKFESLENIKDFDDVRVIVYSDVKSSGVGKKKPDIIEIALSGTKEEKLAFVKDKIGKPISVLEVFPPESQSLVDVRGTTKSKGIQGPVKRFGITLKSHKSEKGQRRPGSLAPWHPARVTFRTAQAGQMGGFSRISYNSSVLQVGKISKEGEDINKKGGFHKYGKIKTDYILLRGSVPGPKKRQLLITSAIRPTRYKSKLKFEMLELR